MSLQISMCMVSVMVVSLVVAKLRTQALDENPTTSSITPDYAKGIAENVSRLQNKLKRTKGAVDNIDFDDEIDEMATEQEIDMDLAMYMNPSEDYNDGDPWNDEENDNYD